MNDSIIILLGASGNLARTKLYPALYRLVKNGKLRNYAIVGAAWDNVTSDHILEQARHHMTEFDPHIFEQFKQRNRYVRVDFSQQKDFDHLQAMVQKTESLYDLTGNRIVYCAVASTFFSHITQYCAASGILERKDVMARPWHRIVYEKPFGTDLASAHTINKIIAAHFDECQVYRIDHYLTKEVVGNIGLLRFTNCVFEPLWNNRYIDNVQIILSEQVGAEGRGAYYDAYGALKDMVQNHMLELVALIGMEAPEKLSGEYIRTERARVIEKVHVVDGVLGQYEGYQQEQDVAPNSQTETFAQLLVKINNVRWAGVPFFLKTGKQLDKKETVIHIKFKQVDCLLLKNCPSDSNYLTIQISPEANFSLSLNAKKPGYAHQVTPITMDFCHSCVFGTVTPESYEVIFEEIIKGEHSISVRFDEIESAWKVIDAIESMNLPVYPYRKGTQGPKECLQFEKKHGMRWRS